MGRTTRFYLSLGSNIEPEAHIRAAVDLLRRYGHIEAISSVWQSQAVGAMGPDFLNVCVSFDASVTADYLKNRIIRDIEARLGRLREDNKNAPRTIDIDILMEEGRALNPERWAYSYVVLPMADLLPDFVHPLTGRRLADEVRLASQALEIRHREDLSF